MKQPKTIENIQKMRNGEKLKCTKCAEGYVSAVGDCKTASLFRCDHCGTSMQMTKK